MSDGTALAYVFWHWRQPSIASAQYEARLRDFHAALAARPLAGFSHSTSSALAGAAWANGGGDAYQDRYFITGSAALDELDRAVIEGARQAAHDAAASSAAGGAAGLYRARLGTPSAEPRYASWFSKPEGMSYGQLFADLAALIEQEQGVLWMRRMVLGPTPEFCLESPRPVSLPEGLSSLTLALRPLWFGDVRSVSVATGGS